MNPYQTIRNELYGIKKKEKVNPFIRGVLPLGTKQSYYSYGNKPSDDEDYSWLPLNPKHQFTAAVLAGPGYGKTQIIKRILYYAHKKNYRILVFDPKGGEYHSIKYKGNAAKLHPQEYPDKIPVKNYVPSFRLQDVDEDDQQFESYTPVSCRLEDFDRLSYFLTMGMSAPAAMTVNTLIQRMKKAGVGINPQYLMALLLDKEHGVKHGGMRDSIINRLGNLTEAGMFDKKYKKIDVVKDWQQNKVVNISFFYGDEKYMGLVTGHTVLDTYKKSNRVIKQPKLIIVDDCHLVASKDMEVSDNLSLQSLLNAVVLWRRHGYNIIFATQSPHLLHPRILEVCKYFIVGRIGAVDYLMDTLGVDRATGVHKVIQGLRSPENSFDREWCFLKGDRIHYETFYHLNPIIGHNYGD